MMDTSACLLILFIMKYTLHPEHILFETDPPEQTSPLVKTDGFHYINVRHSVSCNQEGSYRHMITTCWTNIFHGLTSDNGTT